MQVRDPWRKRGAIDGGRDEILGQTCEFPFFVAICCTAVCEKKGIHASAPHASDGIDCEQPLPIGGRLFELGTPSGSI